jgi:hypothetical protein
MNKFPFTSKGISLIGTCFICLDIGLESTCERLRERFQMFLINVIYNLPRNRWKGVKADDFLVGPPFRSADASGTGCVRCC